MKKKNKRKKKERKCEKEKEKTKQRNTQKTRKVTCSAFCKKESKGIVLFERKTRKSKGYGGAMLLERKKKMRVNVISSCSS